MKNRLPFLLVLLLLSNELSAGRFTNPKLIYSSGHIPFITPDWIDFYESDQYAIIQTSNGKKFNIHKKEGEVSNKAHHSRFVVKNGTSYFTKFIIDNNRLTTITSGDGNDNNAIKIIYDLSASTSAGNELRVAGHADLILGSTEVLDLTSAKYKDLIVNSLKLEDVVEKDYGLEFSWDSGRDTPEGMHYPTEDYERFLSHSALHSVKFTLAMFIFDRERKKDSSKGNKEGLRAAKKLPDLPLSSSFSIQIDREKKRAKLNLLSNPVANKHFVNGEVVGEMPIARALVSESPNSKAVIPAGMYQCILTNLQCDNAPRFLSTACLLDCTALILHDRKSKIATLTHFWTQTVTENIIKKQFDLMIYRGASAPFIEAKVVGCDRYNLWADSGFFNCIVPGIDSLGIPITETNAGDNRPQNILFDVETGNLYHLISNDFDRLDDVCIQNKSTATKLDWSSEAQYYFSDYNNSELFVLAEISLPSETNESQR